MVLQEAEGHGVMDIGGWPGLNKGGKMTAEPKSSLRKVSGTATKFAEGHNETSGSQSTFSSISKFLTITYFPP